MKEIKKSVDVYKRQVQGCIGAQIVIYVFQGKLCLLLLQKPLERDEMMAVIVARFFELFQIILERGHLGFLDTGQQPGSPILLLGRIAFRQPGQNPQTHICLLYTSMRDNHGQESYSCKERRLLFWRGTGSGPGL